MIERRFAVNGRLSRIHAPVAPGVRRALAKRDALEAHAHRHRPHGAAQAPFPESPFMLKRLYDWTFSLAASICQSTH